MIADNVVVITTNVEVKDYSHDISLNHHQRTQLEIPINLHINQSNATLQSIKRSNQATPIENSN